MMSSEDIQIGKIWEAIGPFPSGMREHPLIGTPHSAFLDLSDDADIDFALRPYDPKETWPSEIGIGGQVGWKRFERGDDGWLEVSYPEIRWEQLRFDHGWSSLQYQSILRTTIHVPRIGDRSKTPIRIDVIQGLEYAFIPLPLSQDFKGPVQWYSGDVYDFAGTLTGTKGASGETSNFARSLSLPPGEYVLLIKAIYEIRMFGDPGLSNIPAIRLKISLEVDDVENLEIVKGLNEVPDVVDGWFMGDWISVGMRVPSDAEDVEILEVNGPSDGEVSFVLPASARVRSGQTRPVSIKIEQHKALHHEINSIDIKLKVRIGNISKDVTCHLHLRHIHQNEHPMSPFKITFASPISTSGIPAAISHAMVVPPPSSKTDLNDDPAPVLLILHGAGVDITLPESIQAVPSIPGHWAILPTGRNEWGEDWHGGSMQDVWAARDALSDILRKIGVGISQRIILMGHSNGSQGAWHLAARYPDRIEGVVTACGWLTIQDYVPYTDSTSKHLADPALMGILSSSLAPYNNDLYLSNLVDIPILVIHGAEDDNVPPRHSRSYLNILSSWAGQQDGGNVRLIEVPKQGHWWDDVIKSKDVIEFITKLPKRKSWDEQRKDGFTLTTANPQESGGRAGIRIVELAIPGRIGRLDVNARQWRDSNPAKPLDLRGMNIKRIELRSEGSNSAKILTKCSDQWIDQSSLGPLTPPRAYGPVIRLLSTVGSMTIICPALGRHREIAKKISHDLYVYHRSDSEIIDDKEGLMRVASNTLGDGNVVVIGRPEESLYANWMIKQKKVPIQFPTKGVMLIDDKVVYDRGAGIITLHPHPTSSNGLSVLIAGNDEIGLESAARLFPIRTGVTIPDWAIIGPQARWRGAGGFIGAGFWNDEWKWSETMSWADR